jgi:hypothetical protein
MYAEMNSIFSKPLVISTHSSLDKYAVCGGNTVSKIHRYCPWSRLFSKREKMKLKNGRGAAADAVSVRASTSTSTINT